MTVHKLTAGNGYTYLTRQVAANDATETGYANLGEYYSERGESPGVWLGQGLDGLPLGPASGERVTELQMVALFGQGRHPNAEWLEQDALAAGRSPQVAVAAGGLGKPFDCRSGSAAFRRELARRVQTDNLARDARARAAASEETRARLRTELGIEWFVRDVGRVPRDERELTDYVTGAARPGASPVAGYDLAFSPVKSVSTLWALASGDVAREIEAAHDAAARDVIGWLERDVVFTRLGRNGVRQVDVRGLLAVAFTHRDSRAGDPDLHTHVAISNKVQTLDGRWRALDGRVLYRAAVAASERYNTRLELELVDRLGVRFAERAGEGGKRPVREVVGVDVALMRFWSKRRAAITARHDELAAQFTARHGRVPDFAERARLFGQANTDTRRGKHAPRSEFEQRRTWWREAAAILGGDPAVITMLDHVGIAISPHRAPSTARELDYVWVQRTAAEVIDTVSATYSTWRADIVRAEIERRARAGGVPLADIDAVVEATLSTALSPGLSIRLGKVDEIDEPAALRRRDGSTVFTVAGSQLFTSTAILDAEARLLAAGRLTDGRSVDAETVELALLEARADGTGLNEAQSALVRALATSGRRVQLALAPAGSGKTTALGVLARAWVDAGGEVIGLAPSAAAAAQLRQSLDVRTDTIAKLLHTTDTDRGPAWVRSVGERTLVILDEAGMASTSDLDRMVAFVLARGASVRLVGDNRQLASPRSGGVLRDLAETVGATSLDTLVRFEDPVEAHASLALRAGDPIALGYYLHRDRIHAGDHATVIEHAYAAWTADRTAGRDSILLAPSNEIVRELNTRARADRFARTGTHPAADSADRASGGEGGEVRLHDGTSASAGDVIVTRRNNRHLMITSTDWVKNGDRWQVTAVNPDGALRVVHTNTRRQIVLPASYAQRHVELGYATTVHLAQGATADTCHTVLTGHESREVLYVAMTRARAANHLYLDLACAATEPPANTLAAIRPATSLEILNRILNTETAPRSATTQHRLDTDPAQRLRAASTRYREAAATAPATVPVSVAAGDGPLPWLPPLPTTDDPTWADYLARRYDLVQTLAAAITADTALPNARWTQTLQHKNPNLAHHLAVWRAAHDIPPSDFRPCGPPVADGTGHQRLLLAHVESHVGPMLGPTDRWKPLLDNHAPDLTRDPHWPRLAAAFDRADSDGYDLPGRLPRLLTGLPQYHAGAELFYRLGSECEAALGTKDLAWQPSPEPPHGAHQDTEATLIDLIPRSSPGREGPSR